MNGLDDTLLLEIVKNAINQKWGSKAQINAENEFYQTTKNLYNWDAKQDEDFQAYMLKVFDHVEHIMFALKRIPSTTRVNFLASNDIAIFIYMLDGKSELKCDYIYGNNASEEQIRSFIKGNVTNLTINRG